LADDNGIVVSAAMTKTTLRSTESAAAILTVANNSNQPVVFDSNEISFRYFANGQPQERLTCNRDCWRYRRERTLAPGEQARLTVALPSCRVLSDPCSIDALTLRYVVQAGDRRYDKEIALPQYWFVADPNAVYRNVDSTRPLIVAFGSTQTKIFPDTLEVGVTSASADVFGPIEAALKQAALPIGRVRYERDNLAWYHKLVGIDGAFHIPSKYPPADLRRAVFTVSNISDERLSTVNAVMATVRRRFDTQIDTITYRFMLNMQSLQLDLWPSASGNADPHAQRLVELINGGMLQPPTPLGSSNMTLDNPTGSAWGPDPDVETVAYDIGKLPSMDATLHAQVGYQPTRPANVRISSTVVALARAAFRPANPWPLATPFVETADDRPEIYVQGGASASAALGAGIAPEAVALLAARQNTTTLAQMLGAKIGKESLYLNYDTSETQSSTIGVATIFAGGDPHASEATSREVAVTIHHYSSKGAIANTPIAIPEPETTLNESTAADAPLISRFQRFSIEVDTDDAVPTDRGAAVAAQLRRTPGVVEVAFTPGTDRVTNRFELVVPSAKRKLLAQVAALMAHAYRDRTVRFSYGLGAYLGDCSFFERRLLKVAVHANWLSAEADARAAHKHLRRLIFATASLDSASPACLPPARDPGTLDYHNLAAIPESVAPEAIEASSTMVFRTTP
jgi:hypothetical protein